MWYVIQTITGKEEELINMIRKSIDRDVYSDCFVIKAEWMKRLGGAWEVKVKPMFSGYVFIETEQPECVYTKLKRIPRFTRVLECERYEFVAVCDWEQAFLEEIAGKKRIVQLSDVTTKPDGSIVVHNGALQYFRKEIVKINYHKRIVVVKQTLLQKEQTLILGIRLNKDKLCY